MISWMQDGKGVEDLAVRVREAIAGGPSFLTDKLSVRTCAAEKAIGLRSACLGMVLQIVSEPLLSAA